MPKEVYKVLNLCYLVIIENYCVFVMRIEAYQMAKRHKVEVLT